MEGDSSIVINVVRGIGGGHWEIDLIIKDVKALLACFQEVLIGHVFREANTAADKVAKLGYLG